MGEKIKKNEASTTLDGLAEAIIYLADQIRDGCADIADGLRQEASSRPRLPYVANQMDQGFGPGQGQNRGDFSLQAGADEIPDMRDDLPLPDFGRKAG